MPRVGITGHVRLAAGSEQLIFAAIDDALHDYAEPDLLGVTCLAAGADQAFARAILARRGTLDVVLPARDYRTASVRPENRATFDTLLSRASRISVLPYEKSGHEAYWAASEELLRRCDILIAVWDQDRSDESSHTADVVDLACRDGKKVRVIWPSGAKRAHNLE